MSTSKNTIRGWLAAGQRVGATHMIIVCDTFSNEDYPVYVGEGDDVYAKADKYDDKEMQKIMEVYNFSLSLDQQVEADKYVRNY